jgi:hypothetical protein
MVYRKLDKFRNRIEEEGLFKELKKYFRLERRRFPRFTTSMEVAFCLWDALKGKPVTPEVPGHLVSISRRGACLQTNNMRINNHHLLLDTDAMGKTLLALSFSPPAEEVAWRIKAQVLSYNRNKDGRRFQFDVRLKFVDISGTEKEYLEDLIKTTANA